VMSHRSGETEDVTDRRPGGGNRLRPDQDRSPSRTDRVASTTSCCVERRWARTLVTRAGRSSGLRSWATVAGSSAS